MSLQTSLSYLAVSALSFFPLVVAVGAMLYRVLFRDRVRVGFGVGFAEELRVDERRRRRVSLDQALLRPLDHDLEKGKMHAQLDTQPVQQRGHAHEENDVLGPVLQRIL